MAAFAGDLAMTNLAARPEAPPIPDREERLAAYREARRRGVDWVLRHRNRDGSLGDPSTGFSAYRAPWALQVVGETEAALAYCGWVRRNLVTPDGRIDGPYRVFDDWCTYRDATLIVGAQLCSQYDLSFGLWPALFRVRDPRSGLFANDRLPDGTWSDALDVTAGGPGVGFAALAVGDVATAREIARFLARLWDAQPDLPDRFFHVWSRRRQAIITAADAEFQAPTMLLDRTVDASQYWFWGGICAAFLCRLYQAEPLPEYLDLARRYQEFAQGASDAQFQWPAACKGSWGASLLWQLTGDPRYEAFAFRMGDWYVERQEPDGRWHPLVEQTLGDVIEITLEFVMHLDTLIGALASTPPGTVAP
jgi:hypothetical protein